MLDKNILAFNPVRDSEVQPVGKFPDVREPQHRLKTGGITMITEVNEDSTDPASLMIADPDGNTILVDEYV